MKFEEGRKSIMKDLENLNIEDVDIDEKENEKESEYVYKHRSTFCGTAEYVSPEMIFAEEVGIEADYWALGCILYKLITGSSPFKEKSQFLVFQNIKLLNIKWHDYIPIEAKDLIQRLLKHKPYERLGSKNINEIIDHKFFLNKENNNVIKSMQLNSIPFKNSLKTKASIEEEKLNSNSKKTLDKQHVIKIIKEQEVEKKSPYFYYNTRLLKLDSTPKIEYIDPESKAVKGTIYLSLECEAKVVNTGKFELVTPKRTFVFKVKDDEALIWSKLINEEISKLAEDPKIKTMNEILVNEEKDIITKNNKNQKIY